MWRKTEFYSQNYLVSDKDKVKNVITGKMLTPNMLPTGYLRVELCVNQVKIKMFVHRLVAMAFIPNPDKKPQVNHKNGIRYDNRVSNLEWCTAAENNLHSFRVLNKIHPRGNKGRFGNKHWNSKIVIQKTRDGQFVKEWDCLMDISRQLGYNFRSVSKCCLGKMPTYKNFKWEYKIK